MRPTELKMQPTIHLEHKAGYLPCPYPDLLYKCIVGCIFNSVGLIITREIPCTCFSGQIEHKTSPIETSPRYLTVDVFYQLPLNLSYLTSDTY
jgi:hypothetical protein